MFQINMWTYPWDLVDEGIDLALDVIKGEAGATGVSIATSYHSLEQLRPHDGVSPRTFRTSAGIQFQPQTSLYAGTRIRPVVAPWLKKSNPLAAIAEGCEKRGLKLRSWTVCCHGSAVVAKYPHAAVKDVMGDARATWLCPVNPDVQEYLRALVEDLVGNYPLDTIELERPSFDANPHVHAHHKIGFPLGETGRWLYNLCFCESCRQLARRADVDVDEAAGVVGATLEAAMASGEPIEESPNTYCEKCPPLAAYVDWHCREVTRLIESLKHSVGDRARVVVHRVGNRYLGGTDFKAIAGVCDGLLGHAAYPDRPGAMEEVVNGVKQDTQGEAEVEIGFNACSPPCPGSDSLVRAVTEVARLGVNSVNIYNYGLLPLPRMEWIRRAARYARREAE